MNTSATRGRPCDQSALTYDKLRGRSGIQWPCTETSPEGTERLYADHSFATQPDHCEDYGHDLLTGAANEADEYRAHDPAGRAVLKAAEYLPPHEPVDNEYPLQLIAGRTVYHWHTRTKTRRARQLQAAAPQMWVELCPQDARRLGIGEGDLVRVESRRGGIQAPARLSGTRPGVVFAPFHYGYFDTPGGSGPDGAASAANEVTRTEWDPVSKQPIFKVTAVRVAKLANANGQPAPAPSATAAAPGAGTRLHTRGRPAAKSTSRTSGASP